jgi:hypothetical protein
MPPPRPLSGRMAVLLGGVEGGLLNRRDREGVELDLLCSLRALWFQHFSFYLSTLPPLVAVAFSVTNWLLVRVFRRSGGRSA